MLLHAKLAALTCALAVTTSSALAVTLGDDGLHKAPWMRETFKDLREDLDDANAADKRLMVIIEQRGCIYCTKMHEEVFVEPAIDSLLTEDFYVVQLNMFGDVEVTDFDGTTLAEKDMVRRWNLMFTPTMMFFPESVDEGVTATQAAVVTVPGAFERFTTYNMLNWVKIHGYDTDEPFQKYHARMIAEGAYPE